MDNKNHIEILLEKYFEGMTSIEEEKMLRDYFQQGNIPESLEIYRPMFAFFNQEISKESSVISVIGKSETVIQQTAKKQKKNLIIIRWVTTGIAACFLIFAGITLLNKQEEKLFAHSRIYINGEKYTDIETIRSGTINTLNDLFEGNEEIFSAQIDALDSFIDE